MLSLFPDQHNFPEGFSYQPEFLSSEEEMLLLSHIERLELNPFIFQGFEARRLVRSFGVDYSFNSHELKAGDAIPKEFDRLIEKISAATGIPSQDYQELLVTEYPAGSVINWHRDAPPFGVIAGVSLLSDCRFRLRPYGKKNRKRSDTISFDVRRRSLYVMQGPARYEWEHSIAAVKSRRFSITVRTLLAPAPQHGNVR